MSRARKANRTYAGKPIEPIDIGGRYGRFTVLSKTTEKKSGAYCFLCQCDCGQIRSYPGGQLRRHQRTNGGCGCRSGQWTHRQRAHRQKNNSQSCPREYQSFAAAIRRCTKPHHHNYRNYGGRGIEFRFDSFEHFYEALGPRPPQHSLDRIDVNGHYEVGNVRWATAKEQNNNTRKKQALNLSKTVNC